MAAKVAPGGAKVDPAGYRSVTPESVGPGYQKPGCMSDYCKGGVNGGGEAEQSGDDPYAGNEK